jgi:hypothetical protein
MICLLLAVLMLLSSSVCLFACEQESDDSMQVKESMSAAYQAALKYFNKKNYKQAYKAAVQARDITDQNLMTIEECYIEEYLIKEMGNFYEAKQLLDEVEWPEEKKQTLINRYGNLSMCEAGNIVKFGKIDFDPVEWIVLSVDEVEHEGKKHRVAFILTKDVIGSPDGWGTRSTKYGVSDLHCWCETSFKLQLRVNLNKPEEKSVLYLPLKTEGDDEILARCFAPSKEDIETYLVGDLEQYRKASPTQDAKLQGVSGEYCAYYLRYIGALENGLQYACGVNQKGEIGTKFGRSVRAIGGRVCLRVSLGEIQ